MIKSTKNDRIALNRSASWPTNRLSNTGHRNLFFLVSKKVRCGNIVTRCLTIPKGDILWSVYHHSVLQFPKPSSAYLLSFFVPDDIFQSIANFKKRMPIDNDSVAVSELLKYALSLPPYFASFDWRIAEEEADAGVEFGNVKSFASTNGFLADLRAWGYPEPILSKRIFVKFPAPCWHEKDTVSGFTISSGVT